MIYALNYWVQKRVFDKLTRTLGTCKFLEGIGNLDDREEVPGFGVAPILGIRLPVRGNTGTFLTAESVDGIEDFPEEIEEKGGRDKPSCWESVPLTSGLLRWRPSLTEINGLSLEVTLELDVSDFCPVVLALKGDRNDSPGLLNCLSTVLWLSEMGIRLAGVRCASPTGGRENTGV